MRENASGGTDAFIRFNRGSFVILSIQRVKFTAFADLHHHPGVFYSSPEKRLDRILERAGEEKVDFMIHLGDFCHTPEKYVDFVRRYDRSGIPAYHMLGNHECDECPVEAVKRIYNIPPCGYYHFDCNNFRMIVLDPNYYCLDGRYIHYELKNYYSYGGQLPYLPPEQIAYLRETVLGSPYPCILFSHQSFERAVHGVKNRGEVLKIVRESQRTPGRVVLCINGHHHVDYLRFVDGVPFLDLNSTTHFWCAESHRLFPEAVYREARLAGNTVIYDEPVHAVITLQSDGLIEIAGMSGSMMFGAPRVDPDGREITADCSSVRLRLEPFAANRRKVRAAAAVSSSALSPA